MPSKKNKNNNKDDDDLKEEGNAKVQAVLLADAAFGSRVTADAESYQSLGLRPWSSEASTPAQGLCSLNNVPLVDYQLGFLAANGVEQVIVVMGSGSGNDTALEDYLKRQQELQHQKSSTGLELLFLKDTSLTNAGDALRELYKRNWIRASKKSKPFLLVSGDVVADVDLREAVKAHQHRQSHDAASVLTVVLKPVGGGKTTRPSIVPRAADLVVGLVKASAPTVATADAQGAKDRDLTIDDARDYRVFYYTNDASVSATTLPCAFLGQSQSTSHGPEACGGLEVRRDLLDTGICICSADVLGRLEDEFDYLDLAHDFCHNCVAEEEDGLQTRIYAHVLEESTPTASQSALGRITHASRSYAARVVDFQTYHAISRDLLSRWAYPTVADRMVVAATSGDEDNTTAEPQRYKLVKTDHRKYNPRSGKGGGGTRFSLSGGLPLKSIDNLPEKSSEGSVSTRCHNNLYQYKEVNHPTKVGRTSVCFGPGMMGSYGTVGEDCLVGRCVLGNSVQIADGAKLLDCHVMDGATVGAGASLEACVVAKNAVIGKDVVLGKGCYVGEGCVIGDGVTVKPFTRISLAQDDDDDDWGDDDDYSDSSDEEEEEAVAKASSTKASSGLFDRALVGPDGTGKLWKPELDVDDDDSQDSGVNGTALERLLQLQSIGGDPSEYYRRQARRLLEAEDSEDDGFSDDEEEYSQDHLPFSIGDDPGHAPAVTPEDVVIGRQKGVDVVAEMVEICMEFEDDCHPIENLAIELNSFKFSQNATYSDCATACVLALLRKMGVSPDMTDGRLVSLLKAKLDSFWRDMLQKLCRGLEEEVAIVQALEFAATIDQESADGAAPNATEVATQIAQKLRQGMAFRFVLQTLFDQEVVSEEAILQWAGDRRNQKARGAPEEDPKQKLFATPAVQDFLEWLEEDSDDDDSDDDSDDEDSDEDSD